MAERLGPEVHEHDVVAAAGDEPAGALVPVHVGCGEVGGAQGGSVAAEVDQVVVWAEDEQARAVLTQTQIDAAVRWTGVRSAVARTRAEWVERLIGVQEARRRIPSLQHDRPFQVTRASPVQAKEAS